MTEEQYHHNSSDRNSEHKNGIYEGKSGRKPPEKSDSYRVKPEKGEELYWVVSKLFAKCPYCTALNPNRPILDPTPTPRCLELGHGSKTCLQYM